MQAERSLLLLHRERRVIVSIAVAQGRATLRDISRATQVAARGALVVATSRETSVALIMDTVRRRRVATRGATTAAAMSPPLSPPAWPLLFP